MSDTPHLHVEFFTDSVHNPRLSAEQGKPVYQDTEFVRIRFVGDKQNVFVAPAEDFGTARNPDGSRLRYKEEFHKHYEVFKAGAKDLETGTPLESLGLPASKVAELKASNVFTVEGLAILDGTLLQKLGMGARELKTRAEDFLNKANNVQFADKLQAENAELRKQIEELAKKVNGGSQPSDEYDAKASPFYDWDDETIRLWIEEQGGDKPHHKCSHDTLVQKADELNAKIAAQKAA